MAAIQLNPEHSIPVLVVKDSDGLNEDFVIWDGHAICTFLVEKYSADDKLYPKDVQLRAKCIQRLFFDAKLFAGVRECNNHVLVRSDTEIPKNKIDSIHTQYGILETFLTSDPFLVCNDPTIADICIANTLLVLDIYAPIQKQKYPKILDWIERVRNTVPVFDEISAYPLNEFRKMVHRFMCKNK